MEVWITFPEMVAAVIDVSSRWMSRATTKPCRGLNE